MDALQHFGLAGGDCDVVGPLSTVLGLGSWGPDLGLERLFGLPNETLPFVTNPLNYQRVQVPAPLFFCNVWRSLLSGPAAYEPGQQRRLSAYRGRHWNYDAMCLTDWNTR
jgi:hypothetical protein